MKSPNAWLDCATLVYFGLTAFALVTGVLILVLLPKKFDKDRK